MFILGLQGSPRRKGNTDTMLAAFLDKAAAAGATTHVIQVDRAGIASCRGCGRCEKQGTCVLKDDPMSTEVFGLLREADMVVAASPVYFYGVSAQLKLLMDRCQTLWSRKYVFKLKDPLAATRTGVLFSVAASKGRQLFDGVELTTKYFFDAIDARYAHTLVYRGVEAKGDIHGQPTLDADLDAIIEASVRPMLTRRKVLFVSPGGACRAPMAAAMAQSRFGDRIRCAAGGVHLEAALLPVMVQTMQDGGVDLAYRRPASMDGALRGGQPDIVVAMGSVADEVLPPCQAVLKWDIPMPERPDSDAITTLRQTLAEHTDRLQSVIDSSEPTS